VRGWRVDSKWCLRDSPEMCGHLLPGDQCADAGPERCGQEQSACAKSVRISLKPSLPQLAETTRLKLNASKMWRASMVRINESLACDFELQSHYYSVGRSTGLYQGANRSTTSVVVATSPKMPPSTPIMANAALCKSRFPEAQASLTVIQR
jgi:hypothetical protein